MLPAPLRRDAAPAGGTESACARAEVAGPQAPANGRPENSRPSARSGPGRTASTGPPVPGPARPTSPRRPGVGASAVTVHAPRPWPRRPAAGGRDPAPAPCPGACSVAAPPGREPSSPPTTNSPSTPYRAMLAALSTPERRTPGCARDVAVRSAGRKHAAACLLPGFGEGARRLAGSRRSGWERMLRRMVRTHVRYDGVRAGQPAVHGRSLSGLRTAQMCVIRSSATSNAYTATATPSCSTTRPARPLTVCSRTVRPPDARPARSVR